jgi:hypothetical protein
MDSRRRFLKTASATAFAAALPVANASPIPAMPSEPTFDALYSNSLDSIFLTGEVADRIILKRLVDAWAHCADRRLAEQQARLFTPDGVINNYAGDPATHKPDVLRGRAEIQKALAVLNTFTATFHMNGQSTFHLQSPGSSHAIGETYCMAHQLITSSTGERKLQTFYIRYTDVFIRKDRQWFFQERNLIIEISDTRPSVA